MAQYTKVPDHSHSDNELMPLALDPADALAPVAMRSQINPPRDEISVSYTHLTLPTILLV